MKKEVIFKISLPEEIAEQYSNQSKAEIEQTLAKRLIKCVGMTDQYFLYLNQQERKELGELLEHSLKDGRQVVELVRNLVRLQTGDVEMVLEPSLLDRLQSRCFEPSFPEFLRKVTREQLEAYVGLR